MQNGFDLTAFLNNENEEPEVQNPEAPQGTEAPATSSFDLTKFLAEKPAPDKPDKDYGILDRQRDSVAAQLGESMEGKGEIGKGEALAMNLIPGFMNMAKRTYAEMDSAREALRSKSAYREALEREAQGKPRKDDTSRRDLGMKMAMAFPMVPGANPYLSQPDGGITKSKDIFDELDVTARAGGIRQERLNDLRKQAKSAEEYADLLSAEAEGILKNKTQAKKDAAKRMTANPGGVGAKIANGIITNTGYQLGFWGANMAAPGFGLAVLAADSGSARAAELQNKTYDVDEDGNLVVLHTDDSAGAANVKGYLGGVAEVAIEQSLEKGLGLMFKGAKMLPGVGKYIGKAGDAVSGAADKVIGAAAAKLSKKPAGKFIVGAAQNFGKYQKYTGVNGLPMEMLEEHVQDFCDDVLGLNTQDRVYSDVGHEAAKWWHEKFWNAEHNKELFLGLVGTMALQGAYAGTKAHRDILKWRQNPAGFLKTMVDDKTVDALSDDELWHLYNFVTSDGFTKENVERFLGHVQKRAELASALTELRNAQDSFWTDDETKAGIKSKFNLPTRASDKAAGGREIDYHPFRLRDGRTVDRAYDPETGIAIDRYDKTHFVVTSADGMKLPVVGADEAEAGQKALAMADKCSVNEQILDAQRPKKRQYIMDRVEKLGGRDKFIGTDNIRAFNRAFPDLMKDTDYSTDNPAIKLADGRIVLVVDNIRSPYEVNRIIAHESAIHNGLAKSFTPEDKAKFLQGIKDPEIEAYKKRVDESRKSRGLPQIDWNQPRYIEEQFAHVWDRRRANPTIGNKVEHFLRDFARKAGLPADYNPADLEVMVDEMQRDAMEKSDDGGIEFIDTPLDHSDSIPYNEGTRTFEGETADPHKPAPLTPEKAAARNMARADRISKAHPVLWRNILEKHDGDEDAALDEFTEAFAEARAGNPQTISPYEPAERSEYANLIREENRRERIRAGHPHLFEYAMRETQGDEDAAMDIIGQRLENEAREGRAGETEKAAHAAVIVSRIEAREDLLPEDIDYLNQRLGNPQGTKRERKIAETSISEDYLYNNLGYRRQKDGSWRYAGKSAAPAKKEQAKKPPKEKPTFPVKADMGSADSVENQTIIEKLTKNAPIEMLNPKNISGSDARIPNFKRGADSQTGIKEPLQGEPKDLLANPIVVMRFNDGEEHVVTGRHRLDLYKRFGRKEIPSRVLKENDGWTIQDAEVIDAVSNILDGQGSIEDYVKFLNEADLTRKQAEDSGILRGKGKVAWSIHEGASDDLRAAIDWEGAGVDNTLTPEQAAVIAENAPKDGDKVNGGVQRAVMRQVFKNPKIDGLRLKGLTLRYQKMAQDARKENPGAAVEGSDDLFAAFGVDTTALDLADKEENYKAGRAAEYRRIAKDIRDSKNSKGRLNISSEFAKELGISASADRKTLENAAKRAVERAFEWERVVLNAEDQAEMDAALQDERERASTGLEPKPLSSSVQTPAASATGQESGNSPQEAAKPTAQVEKPTETPTEPQNTHPVAKEGQNQSKTPVETPKTALGGVDLGENAAAFDNALDNMWFGRDLEDDFGDMTRYGIMSRHDDETKQQRLERIRRFYPNGLQRSGKLVEAVVLATGIRRSDFQKTLGEVERFHEVLHDKGVDVSWVPEIKIPETAIGNVPVARGYKSSDLFLNLGNGDYDDFQAGLAGILRYNEVFGHANPLKITRFGVAGGNLYAIATVKSIAPSMTSPRRWFLSHDWSDGGMGGGFDDLGARYFKRGSFEVGESGANIVTVGDMEVPFGVEIFDRRDFEYANERRKKPQGKRVDDYTQGTFWMSRALEGKSEEEIEAHNLVTGLKAIKAFAAAGLRDFPTFAKAVKTRKPEVYERIKDSMLGMWTNAIFKGVDLDEISIADARGVLKDLDSVIETGTETPKPVIKTPESVIKTPETAPKPVPVVRTDGEIDKGKRISDAADKVLALIDAGNKFSREDLTRTVEDAMGGKVAEGKLEMKDVTDILELAVNRKLRALDSLVSPAANNDADSAVRAIQRIRDEILAVIPTQTTRSAEQDKMQQFSTPPHEAFCAAWVANVKDGDVSLEPSAGIGGIAVFSKIAGADVIVNELSPRRGAILNELGLSPKVYDFNAEDLHALFYPRIKSGEIKRPTVVVMNPPFSNSQRTSAKDTFGIGGKHVEEALNLLAPGGRLVAVVGSGMAHNTDSPKARAWWRKIGEKYQVRADVRVNGAEYTKYGTSYDNDIIVIDKVAPDNTKEPVYGTIETLDELPALLEGVRNDRPQINDREAEPAAGEHGGGQGNVRSGEPSNAGETGNPGPRAGESGKGGTSGGQRSDAGSLGPRPKADAGSGKAADGKGVGGRGVASNAVRGGSGARDHVGSAPEFNEPADVESVSSAAAPAGTHDVREVGNGTFAEYRPSKVRVEGAKPHPTALVESTAMASVLPPDPTYQPKLPKSAIERGMPSEAQIEQILYAGQAHEILLPDGRRRGYFFGDGTGLGKGTEIGGVISDNYNHGRKKAIWVTKNGSLFDDAKRDLVTYGLDGELFDFDPRKINTIKARSHGIGFVTYPGLAQDVAFDTAGKATGAKKGKITRFQHIVDWLGKDYDGVVVFDESHLAGNAIPMKGKRGVKQASARAKAVVALQDALPNARILYVSATGATEVSNLSYATRLGLWGEGTAFRDRNEFIDKVSSGGLSVMEIVARDMKSMGAYLARSLSYEGIVNRKIEHQLSPDQKRKYDEMAEAWTLVSENIREALISTGAAGSSKAVSAAMSAFWGGQQRFFNQVLTAMQMPSVLKDAKAQLAAGNSIVFQLVNTNEATQEKAIKEVKARGEEVNAEEIDLSPRDILVSLVDHSFPTVKYVAQEDADGNTEYVILTDPVSGQPVEDPVALEAKQELLDKLRMMKLDESPLEVLLGEFGYDNVAEITGRSRRREPVEKDGEITFEFVNRSKAKRDQEIEDFNAGKRHILVFSDAGGTGKSFHADKRYGNQQKRIHYLIQAGWRADAALQGFGRTHRSNEVQPPEYVLCSTDIKGHQRFISTVARRLAQLGSLTAGDRSSAGSGVFSEEDNLENAYADAAVKQFFSDMYRDDFGRFNLVCKQLGFMKYKVDKRSGEVKEMNTLIDAQKGGIDVSKIPEVPKFLNRILMCKVDLQNQLFDEFAGLMNDLIETAKENGKYDPGLERLQGDRIVEKERTEIWNNGMGTGSTDIVEVGVSKKTRRTDFDAANDFLAKSAEGRGHFFVQNTNSGKVIGLAVTPRQKTLESGQIVDIYRAIAPDGKREFLTADKVRFDGERMNSRRLDEDEARKMWDDALANVPEMDETSRFFVHGTLLPIWDRLAPKDPRIYRIAPSDGSQSFLGMEVKADSVNDLLRRFGKSARAIELTPEIVMNRVIHDGKAVRLQYAAGTYELRRAKVLGEYRIEVKGLESVYEMRPFTDDGLAFMERINYVPRLFVPRTNEALTAFLAKYPAEPEDGGISNVGTAAGSEYAAMNREEIHNALNEAINEMRDAGGPDWVNASKKMTDILSVLSNDDLRKTSISFQQYDTGRADDPVTTLRMKIRNELKSRGVDVRMDDADLWFSRDLELDDDLSNVSIYEMNRWREARGMPKFGKARKTKVASIVKEGKFRASNREEMQRAIDVTNRTPVNWTATEVTAAHEHILNLERDWEAKDAAYNEALLNGNEEQAAEIKKVRDEIVSQIDAAQLAIRQTAREWGLAGLARRFMLNRNGNFVKFLGALRADAGRKLTEEEEQGARILWDAYRSAQGKVDEAVIRKTSEILKDIVAKHNNREAEVHFKEKGKDMATIEREYQYALDHIAVHAARAGGVMTGLPNGRKWIDAIRRFHMAAGLEAGHKLTVNEMLEAIHADIDKLIKADDHDILQIVTNYGNTHQPDDSMLEKSLRDQREQMREWQKQATMLEDAMLPKKTGRIADEPSAELRAEKRSTAEIMKDLLEQHPELLAVDSEKRLRTVQQAWTRRVQNEIEDLKRAIESGERINRKPSAIPYTEEMAELRKQLEDKRREYADMFPPPELTHEQRVERVLNALRRRKALLEEKLNALNAATTDEERAKILGKGERVKVSDPRIDEMRGEIAELNEDIEEVHDLHFPAGTPEELLAAIRRRMKGLSKNLQEIERKLAAHDYSTKRPQSEISSAVNSTREVMDAVKLRNAAAKRLAEERKRFKRTLIPYSGSGKVLDWWEAVTSAPRILRTMLDLSATFTQGAALTTSHPVLGYRALVNSIKSFWSEENTDRIQAALNADPDWAEFQELGGHIYNVSNIEESAIPEEFRGIDRKLLTIRGKDYGISDIPGVKASERSFGMFLNCINLSVYKALKNAGGWGPTGPTVTQKKDIANSLNVASGYGYDSTGRQGFWDNLVSSAMWAPRFAVSGLKMATAYNVWRPHLSVAGDTSERTYGDRATSSKQMAKEYARQLTGMAAWTLLATLLLGNKDPDYLREVIDPRSSEFLNVLIGNTRINFFGPIKQWWQFMTRLLSGQTVKNGKVRKTPMSQTIIRMARSKASPIAGTIWSMIEGRDFTGEEYTLGKAAIDLTIPLSGGDLVEAFQGNSLANALMLTPFIVAGAGKSTYEIDAYEMSVNPYLYLASQAKDLKKQGDWAAYRALRAENKVLGFSSTIDTLIGRVNATKKQIKQFEKEGREPTPALIDRLRREQQQVIDYLNKHK